MGSLLEGATCLILGTVPRPVFESRETGDRRRAGGRRETGGDRQARLPNPSSYALGEKEAMRSLLGATCARGVRAPRGVCDPGVEG